MAYFLPEFLNYSAILLTGTAEYHVQMTLSFHPLPNIPLVKPGDNLAELVVGALHDAGLEACDGDVLIVAQKLVSKAEGRQVLLTDVQPSSEAEALAAEVNKDPRLVELILRESNRIVRTAPGVLIVQHRLGIVCANAGIDQSNVDHSGGECALLLPEDPDRSARDLRKRLLAATGAPVGVIISDSINRPWRLGTVAIAVGSSGVQVLKDQRGETDLFGRELQVTMSNRADALATAATLIMGETTERTPAVLVRGLPPESSAQAARDAIRPPEEDLFL